MHGDNIHDEWDEPKRLYELNNDRPESIAWLFISLLLIVGLCAAFVACCYER